MPLPSNISPVTVTGTYVGVDGTAATGTVTFTPSKGTWLEDATGPAIIIPDTITGTLDASGHFSVELVPTNATEVAPTGFTYDIVENLSVTVGGKAFPFTRSYSILAPSGSSFDLATVAPVDSSGGGAARSVLIVNGITPDNSGAITLTAANVGALTQSTADARYDAIGAAATETTRAEAAEATLLPKTDPSVTNARTPTAHASTHATGGSDPVTPASIGALPAQAPVTLTDAATIETDASQSSHFRVTLTGNHTLDNPSGAVDGQKVLWEITQDATGGRTLTLGSAFKLGSDVASATLSTAPGARDFFGAIYNSTTGAWDVIAVARGY